MIGPDDASPQRSLPGLMVSRLVSVLNLLDGFEMSQDRMR